MSRNEEEYMNAAKVEASGEPEPEAPPAPAPAFPALQYASTPQYLPRDVKGSFTANSLAEYILDRYAIVYEGLTKSVWAYEGARWTEISKELIEAWALSIDTAATTQKKRAEAANYVMRAVYHQRIKWDTLEANEVPLGNGILNVLTEELRPHRPEDYIQTVIPTNWDPDAQPDLWLKTLDDYFKDDPDREVKTQTIQQFFGYCLLPHAAYKRALVLFGSRDCGKSVVSNTLKGMIGADNTCVVPAHHMDDPKKIAPIYGKLLNLLTELSTDSMIADGGFKQLVSTGDPVQLDIKWKPQFLYVPKAKHVIVGNTLPQTTDQTEGVTSRLLIVKFHRQFSPDEQDTKLQSKLDRELPGILRWAVDGAADLIRNHGIFPSIDESEVLKEEYRVETNPLRGFLEAKCVEDPDAHVFMADLRPRFLDYTRKAYTDRQIATMVRNLGYEIKPMWWGSRAKSMRSLIGFRWDEQGR